MAPKRCQCLNPHNLWICQLFGKSELRFQMELWVLILYLGVLGPLPGGAVMATCRLNPTLGQSLPVRGSLRRFGEGSGGDMGVWSLWTWCSSSRWRLLPPLLLCVSRVDLWFQRFRAKKDAPVKNKLLDENCLWGHFRVEGSELLFSWLSAFKLISSWGLNGLCHPLWVEQTAPNPFLI